MRSAPLSPFLLAAPSTVAPLPVKAPAPAKPANQN